MSEATGAFTMTNLMSALHRKCFNPADLLRRKLTIDEPADRTNSSARRDLVELVTSRRAVPYEMFVFAHIQRQVN